MSDAFNDNRTRFAYGDWKRAGCKCPARAAGETVVGFAADVVDNYDATAREEHDEYPGVILEREARRYWLDLLELYPGKSKEYTWIVKVAVELDWLPEDYNA